jgi:NTP pyrophosphatase (non-canonical NTP hydrolase)
MEIKDLIKEAHENAVKHGFWEDYKFLSNLSSDVNNVFAVDKSLKLLDVKSMADNAIGNRLMLITGEVAEAHEALRKNDADNFQEELADIVIRIFDLCGGLTIDLEAEIHKKMEKNKDRPYKHGKAF